MSDLKALLLGPVDVAKWLSDMMTGEFYDILDVMTTWPLPDGSLSTKYRIIRYPLYLCTIIAKLISSANLFLLLLKCLCAAEQFLFTFS